jgi:short-subunit dehydrogenase
MTDERVAALVDLNVRSTLELARAFAALSSGDRPSPAGIVFVTSIAGAVGVPGESVYSATKAAVEAFAVVLREELRPAGVGVSTVLPGVVETSFFDTRGVPYDRTVPRPVPPQRVAAAVVRALERGTPRTVVPRWLAFPAWLSAALPGPYRALARRFS